MLDNYPDKTEWTKELYPILWQIDLAFRMRDEKSLAEGLRNLSNWMDQDYFALERQRKRKALAERLSSRQWHYFGLDAYDADAFVDDSEEEDENQD